MIENDEQLTQAYDRLSAMYRERDLQRLGAPGGQCALGAAGDLETQIRELQREVATYLIARGRTS